MPGSLFKLYRLKYILTIQNDNNNNNSDNKILLNFVSVKFNK